MTKPNILFLMTDQMQAAPLNPEHPCLTPNLDKLAARGMHIRNAYTSNAVCSPARAGIMTGLLPHNHGVITVTHVVDKDQSQLRTEYPHFAQHLVDAGYRTSYFGKWHVENTNKLDDFGWQQYETGGFRTERQHEFSVVGYSDNEGYNRQVFYGATTVPVEERYVANVTRRTLDWLDTIDEETAPWCCFVSCIEPHDPFICSQSAYDMYNVDDFPVPPNWNDELQNRPGLYRRVAGIFEHMSEQQKKEAAICYYASITEIDQQYGRIIDKLEAMGKLDNTIIIFTTDHGELLGAHGMYCKNFTGAEEIYRIPMLLAGPGIPEGVVTDARVGSHDLAPTICDLAEAQPIDNTDSRSFLPLIQDPEGQHDEFQTGYAESFGGRYYYTQRVYWDGHWKYIFNGFDFDEMYKLDEDPYEMNNLADDPAYTAKAKELMTGVWQRIRKTNDHSLLRSHYPILRLGVCGPNDAE